MQLVILFLYTFFFNPSVTCDGQSLSALSKRSQDEVQRSVRDGALVKCLEIYEYCFSRLLFHFWNRAQHNLTYYSAFEFVVTQGCSSLDTVKGWTCSINLMLYQLSILKENTMHTICLYSC